MSRVFFFIGEGLRALRRSAAPSVAAIVTVGVTMVMLGVLIPVLQATSGKTEEVRDQVGLRVYLFDDATQRETDQLQEQIGQIQHVASVEYVSKDEALASLSDRFKSKQEDDLTEQLPGARNPLPASFNVKPDDLDNLGSVRAGLTPPGANGKPAPISPIIEEVGESRDEADTISSVTGKIKIALIVVASMLGVTSLLLVANTIRLSIYARRREIEVMQLVGATNWFVRWPFVVEGLVCGLLGGIGAVVVLFLGKETVLDPLAESFDLVSSEQTIGFATLIVILLAAAMTVSAIGSGLTLRRFLRV
ncbi:MAG: permease-like cell division protein FtsX [Actinomycetota bacterium]|nr:permease-like cell division protein FtsX [Actinomycetota bacterium]